MASLESRIVQALGQPEVHGWALQAWVNVRPGEATTGLLRVQTMALSGSYKAAVTLSKGEWQGEPAGPLQAAWCLRELVQSMGLSLGALKDSGLF